MPASTLADYQAVHFKWRVADRVGCIEMNRPERKNPLTFESYAELRDLFRALRYAGDVHAVVFSGAGGNFCSGGDVHEIIGPLTRMSAPQLLDFTRMTGDLVRAMRACPQVIIAAVDGVCAGAGAIIAMASDIRLATPAARTAFLFSGRAMTAEEGVAWGFFSRLVASDALAPEAVKLAMECARGPVFAHAMTKTMLNQEWNMGLDQALEAEAQAQALCMQTEDFKRAFEAFAKRAKPEFVGR
jgi:enoyl-CoA hydratase/carnithine racemase